MNENIIDGKENTDFINIPKNTHSSKQETSNEGIEVVLTLPEAEYKLYVFNKNSTNWEEFTKNPTKGEIIIDFELCKVLFIHDHLPYSIIEPNSIILNDVLDSKSLVFKVFDESLRRMRIFCFVMNNDNLAYQVHSCFTKYIVNVLDYSLKTYITEDKQTNIEIESFGSTRVGFNPNNSSHKNQDAVVIRKLCSTSTLYLICDGHGPYGEAVSKFVVENLSNSLLRVANPNISHHDKILSYLEELIYEVDLELMELSAIDTTVSGCSLLLCLQKNNCLFFANVGDCSAFFAENHKISQVNTLHKLSNLHERVQVSLAGGEVRRQIGKNGKYGPHRVYIKAKDSPGLCVSRVIGNRAAKQAGLTAKPELLCLHINTLVDKELNLMLVSKGVYEYIPSQDISALVNKSEGIMTESVNSVFKAAIKQWRKHETIVDDMSIIIVKMSKVTDAYI